MANIILRRSWNSEIKGFYNDEFPELNANYEDGIKGNKNPPNFSLGSIISIFYFLVYYLPNLLNSCIWLSLKSTLNLSFNSFLHSSKKIIIAIIKHKIIEIKNRFFIGYEYSVFLFMGFYFSLRWSFWRRVYAPGRFL